jgi:hypothetical protein
VSTYVEINGTSRPLQSASVELSLKQRGFANVVLVDVGNAYTVSEGQQIEIGDGVGAIFGGTIDEATAQWIHPSTTRFWSLRCVSYEQITSRRFVGQRVYARQAAGDIIRDLVTECLTSEGINVDDVLDGPDVGPLQFDYETVEEAFDIIAGAAGMYWDIIFNRHLRFFTRTTYAAPWAITATSPKVRRMDGVISLVTDRQRVANRVYVRLGQYLGATETETYPGDGSSTLFQLLKPIGAEPTIRVNGTDKTVGIQGVDTGKDWYWQVGSQTVEQDASGTVLTSGDDLEVVYVPLESKVLLGAQDSTAISARATLEGLSGVYDYMIDLGTPTTQQQAEDIAAAHLAQHKNPTRSLTFTTAERDLAVGMAINVTLPAVGLASATAFLIESVRFTDGIGQTPLTQCTCSTGALLPTWQQVLAGGGGSGATQIATSSTGTAAAASVFIRRPAQLTTNTTITESEPATDEKLLIVFIKQGAASAYTITFDSAKFAATPTNISPELGTISAYMFAGNTATGKWELSTNPFTEVTL